MQTPITTTWFPGAAGVVYMSDRLKCTAYLCVNFSAHSALLHHRFHQDLLKVIDGTLGMNVAITFFIFALQCRPSLLAPASPGAAGVVKLSDRLKCTAYL